VQTVSPTLASGLRLARDQGVMISDVLPTSPAASGGLEIADIVVAVDGMPVDSVPRLAQHVFARSPGDRLRFDVLRGEDIIGVDVIAAERGDDPGCSSDLVDPAINVIDRLGIVGVDVSDRARQTSTLRERSGVVVIGHTAQDDSIEPVLMTGDTIHRVNTEIVRSISDLRRAVEALKQQSHIVLQVERNVQFSFLALELN
jgi:S1-C subfamily serine protease